MNKFFRTFHVREILIDAAIVGISFLTSFLGVSLFPSSTKSLYFSLVVIFALSIGVFCMAYYFGRLVAEKLGEAYSSLNSNESLFSSPLFAISQGLFIIATYAYIFEIQLILTMALTTILSGFIGFCYAQEGFNYEIPKADRTSLSRLYKQSITTYGQLYIFVALGVLPGEILIRLHDFKFWQTEVFSSVIIGLALALLVAKATDRLFRRIRVSQRTKYSRSRHGASLISRIIPILIIMTFGIFEDELSRLLKIREIKDGQYILLLTAAGFIPLRIVAFINQEKTAINTATLALALAAYYGFL
jgi:hypothetical protein